MELWSNTATLERVAQLTPYVFIALGALVGASGLYLKGLIEKRVHYLDERAEERAKHTPPDINVTLGTATANGEYIDGRTLLQITTNNDVEFNASWLVTTLEDKVVSPIMTSKVRIVPAATPIITTPVTINDGRVIDEYIELRFRYESVHSPELGNPDHLRGKVSVPFRYAEGRVHFPTRAMLDYWRARHPDDRSDQGEHLEPSTQ